MADSLLLKPVDHGRLSSPFGMRHHPILKRRQMHRGIDWAAPRGTPVRAAGHGVIVAAVPLGAYGRYVQIDHGGTLATAYVHLGRYAEGLRPGHAVHQGDLIGSVGSTGRATGPHLHYEILVAGRQVDPLAFTPVVAAPSVAHGSELAIGGPDLLLIDGRDHRTGEVHTVLDDASIQGPGGATIGITGPSGSGKTSLLHLLAGIGHPDAGRIAWDEVEIAALGESGRDRWRRDNVGLVFQDFHLRPAMPVFENVLLSATFDRFRVPAALRARARSSSGLARRSRTGRSRRSRAASSSAWRSPASCSGSPASLWRTSRPQASIRPTA